MSQYATFRLGDRLFGLDLTSIREINRILDITPVPHSREHVRGLINLRGQIVTILDLGVRLGLERQDACETSHNIILKASGNDLVGLLVDAIGDVVEADPSTMEPPSANVSEAEAGCLAGVIKADSGLLVLLDIHEVLANE